MSSRRCGKPAIMPLPPMPIWDNSAMAVHLLPPDPTRLAAIAGVRLATVEARIRKPGRKDLTLFELAEGSVAAGVFTRNRFCAAPVQLCREHLGAERELRALVINTGCANAGTGAQGLQAARRSCARAAALLGVRASQVLPFSTGVILEHLPIERLEAGLDQAAAALGPADGHAWAAAAAAIMTTDTVPKAASAEALIDGVRVRATGIAKGAGMIRPDMATMLGFVATDARVAPEVLQQAVRRVADGSFNAITVDGDTSTNDSFVVVATGRAPMATTLDRAEGPAYEAFCALLLEVARPLAQAIVRDGEGATKFIEIEVGGARTFDEARKVAYAIAHSPLVKTAFFASDPNLGRILAAVGYAGIDDLDQGSIELYLDDVHVATGGGRHPDYREEDGQRVMRQSDIKVRVELQRAAAPHAARATIWTCDLSHDYVSINADYRS